MVHAVDVLQHLPFDQMPRIVHRLDAVPRQPHLDQPIHKPNAGEDIPVRFQSTPASSSIKGQEAANGAKRSMRTLTKSLLKLFGRPTFKNACVYSFGKNNAAGFSPLVRRDGFSAGFDVVVDELLADVFRFGGQLVPGRQV